MAGIFAHIEDDIAKIRKLKNEIESVKTSLKGINIKVDIDIKAGLENQLKMLNAEYTALANKIAETEGKVTNSVNKINQATEKIVQQQQKIVSNVVNSENIADTTAGQTQQVSNEALSATYNELRQQIEGVLGSRMANIKRLVEEKNAIDTINTEIKELNKAQKDNGFLTSDQSARLEKLNSELFERKQVVSTLTSTIKMQTKEEQASLGSMNQLSAQLDLLRKSYRALTEEQKNSPMGQSFLEAIEQADNAIKGLDGSIGNYQRNVGNYAKGWNGLNFSIQQLAREMPSLAYGPQIFFSAISNNLPIFADELKRAKEEYNAFKASGQQATPVWKQLLSSLVSWQTALTVGITLLTLYGDKIVDWISSLIKGDSALKEMEESMKKRAKEIADSFTSSYGNSAGKMRASYEELRRKWAQIDSEAKKLKFINKHKDEINKFGFAVKNVIDAENLFNKNTNNVVASFEARARAAAASEAMTKAWTDYYEQIGKNEEKLKFKKFTKKDAENQLGAGISNYNVATGQYENVPTYTDEDIYNKVQEENKKRADKARKDFKEANDLAKKQRDKLIKQYSDENKKAKEELEKSGALEEIITKKDESAEEKARKEAEKLAKQQSKLSQVKAEISAKQAKQSRDNAIAQRQLEIDLMQEGTDKAIAQIVLNYQKEMNAIKDWEAELRKTKIEEARKTFEADPTNKGKKFIAKKVNTELSQDESSLKSQKSKNTFIAYVTSLTQVLNTQLDAEKQANAEYIKEYGTYLEKKQLLQEEHNKRLDEIKQKGGGENAIKLENANYQASLNELEVAYGKTANKINILFADARGKSVAELRKIAKEAREALKWVQNNAFDPKNKYGITQEQYNKLKNDPTALKNTEEGIENIEDKANSLDTAFGVLKEGIDKCFNTDNLEDFDKGLALISQGVSDITGALNVVSGALKSLGAEGVANVLDEVSNVLNTTMQGAQAGSAFGKIGAAIGGAIGLIGSLGGALAKLKDSKHEAKIVELQEQISALNESYADLSDEIEKAYSHDAKNLIESENELLKQKKGLVQEQIKEEEAKKKTDKDRIKGYEEELKSIDKQLEDNKAKAKDAIFGEDLQTAIENFASAYADAIASGDTAWTSSKDYAKNMMKQMVMESIKAAVSSSKAIEQIRNQLDEFYKDGVLSATEQAWVYEATENAMRDIQNQFGWADDLLSDSATQQSATRKGLESLTQEQGEELNGRFTALQLAGEKMAVDMAEQTAQLTLLNATTVDLRQMSENAHNTLSGIADQIAQSYLELQEINENTGQSAKALKAIQADIAEVKNNTAKLV